MKIQDVAKKANVGVGTVSRVLNNNGYVSEKTRKKVEAAIEELQYTPNELARNLYHKKTNTIAVIVPDISNPFYSSLVNEIEQYLRMQGYKTLLCNTVGEKTNEALYLNMLERNMVDGVLTATHSLDGKKYERISGPVVSFDTPILCEKIPVITVNHQEGGKMAAQELLKAGCKHVLQFRDDVSKKFPYFSRHEEFEQVINQSGGICENYITKWDCFEDDYYERLVRECVEQYPEIDGIFATDMLAAIYMKVVQEKGKRIPEDIKVIAYDGTWLKNAVYPTLTYVKQPISDIAKVGVDVLMKMIQGESIQEKEIQLPVSLKTGMTTGHRREKGKENE